MDTVLWMRAMVFEAFGQPLALRHRSLPVPVGHDVLIEVEACGVCRTDLHLVERELPDVRLPVVPGHEVVGVIVARGEEAGTFTLGTRVGLGWLASHCGRCRFCLSSRENLCADARFTGATRDGGYATHVVADERVLVPLPPEVDASVMAPWMCAGAIGQRAWRMAGEARRIGLWGFGASAHLVARLAAASGQEVYAFTRVGDTSAAALATECGATWVGSSDDRPDVALDAAIIFAPSGELVPRALRMVERGGTVVCAGIHMTDIPSFPYRELWGERMLRSVANVTRADLAAFVRKAIELEIRPQVTPYALSAANEALDALRHGRISGAAVLLPARDPVRPRRRRPDRPVAEWRIAP